MSIKSRLERIEQRYNPNTHRPLVVAWFDEIEPEFKNKPETKEEAIAFLQARAREADRTTEKDLVLMPVDSTVPTLKSYLMDKFDIEPKDLDQ